MHIGRQLLVLEHDLVKGTGTGTIIAITITITIDIDIDITTDVTIDIGSGTDIIAIAIVVIEISPFLYLDTAEIPMPVLPTHSISLMPCLHLR